MQYFGFELRMILPKMVSTSKGNSPVKQTMSDTEEDFYVLGK